MFEYEFAVTIETDQRLSSEVLDVIRNLRAEFAEAVEDVLTITNDYTEQPGELGNRVFFSEYPPAVESWTHTTSPAQPLTGGTFSA